MSFWTHSSHLLLNAIRTILIYLALITPSTAFAASTTTDNVAVQLLSVTANNSALLVQTSPRHSLTGLNCTDDYWLVLSHNEVGFDAMLALLLAAQRSGSTLLVRADDNGGAQFCKLGRVVTYP